MAYQRHKRKINAIVIHIIEGTSSSDANEWNENVDNEVHVDWHNIGDVLDADASDASNEDHLEQVVVCSVVFVNPILYTPFSSMLLQSVQSCKHKVYLVEIGYCRYQYRRSFVMLQPDLSLKL